MSPSKLGVAKREQRVLHVILLNLRSGSHDLTRYDPGRVRHVPYPFFYRTRTLALAFPPFNSRSGSHPAKI
jgi:hypothetical protein